MAARGRGARCSEAIICARLLVDRVMHTPDATEQTSIIETIRLPDIGVNRLPNLTLDRRPILTLLSDVFWR